MNDENLMEDEADYGIEEVTPAKPSEPLEEMDDEDEFFKPIAISSEPAPQPKQNGWRKIHKRSGRRVREWVENMKRSRAAGLQIEETPLALQAKTRNDEGDNRDESWSPRERPAPYARKSSSKRQDDHDERMDAQLDESVGYGPQRGRGRRHRGDRGDRDDRAGFGYKAKDKEGWNSRLGRWNDEEMDKDEDKKYGGMLSWGQREETRREFKRPVLEARRVDVVEDEFEAYIRNSKSDKPESKKTEKNPSRSPAFAMEVDDVEAEKRRQRAMRFGS